MKSNIGKKADGQTLCGKICEIIYTSEDETFKIARFKPENEDEITITGNLILANMGDEVSIKGSWTNHRIYGEQFKVDSYVPRTPSTAESAYDFLSSGVISGVGPATARRIVDLFGAASLEILEKNPKKYLEVDGIGDKTLDKIMESYNETFMLKNIISDLASHGISSNTAIRLFNVYKDNTLEILYTNPYSICGRVRGIGFKKADEIAVKLGVGLDSLERKKQAVIHVLNEASYDGHTYIQFPHLAGELSRLLGGITKEELEETLFEMYGEKLIIIEEKEEEKRIYLYNYCLAEVQCACGIIRLLTSDKGKYLAEEAEKIVQTEIKKQPMKLSSEQIESAISALSNKMIVITGGPGTGKTTVLKFLVQIFESLGKKIKLCAPTGKASKRMTETTGRPAMTIHRLLEMGVSDGGDFEVYARDEDNPLNLDVLVVDEASMIDVILMKNLISAIPDDARLILVGDVDQLPSVGAGNVLKDILSSQIIPSVKLTEVFRQARESNIIMNAHRINSGQMPLSNDKEKDFFIMGGDSPKQIEDLIVELVTTRLPNYYKLDSNDIQILAPMKKNTIGTENLNIILQNALNPPKKEKQEYKNRGRVFRSGDRVIHIKNNYEKEWSIGEENGRGVFNGESGNIIALDKYQGSLIVQFDDGKRAHYDLRELDELEHSFAITVHKSQGSEYPCVILPVYKVSPMLLNRKILYTAITRAKSLLILITDNSSLKKMVTNTYIQHRNSSLNEKLEIFLYSGMLEE